MLGLPWIFGSGEHEVGTDSKLAVHEMLAVPSLIITHTLIHTTFEINFCELE